MSVVDSHHHFWNYAVAEYGWIGEEMGVLRRDFSPGDLVAELDAAGVDIAISVQARQSVEETESLLKLAGGNGRIAGVVGWVPLAAVDVAGHLDRFGDEEKLVGVRHVVQDEPDDDFILGTDFNRGVASLAGRGLTYDILIFERHLPQTSRFVDRHPDQVFVLDHLGKPVIEGTPSEAWQSGIAELARRENVFCKVSGAVTEVRGGMWDDALLRPYFEHVLAHFGPGRLMFGSDWPVCLLRSTYRRWADTVRGFVSELSRDEREATLGGNALRAYGIAPPAAAGGDF